MAAIMTFYRIKQKNSNHFFDEKEENKERDPNSSDLSY